MNEIQQLYETLTQKGMINMSPEEFQQLPQEEYAKYASLLGGGMPQMQLGGNAGGRKELINNIPLMDIRGMHLSNNSGSHKRPYKPNIEQYGYTRKIGANDPYTGNYEIDYRKPYELDYDTTHRGVGTEYVFNHSNGTPERDPLKMSSDISKENMTRPFSTNYSNVQPIYLDRSKTKPLQANIDDSNLYQVPQMRNNNREPIINSSNLGREMDAYRNRNKYQDGDYYQTDSDLVSGIGTSLADASQGDIGDYASKSTPTFGKTMSWEGKGGGAGSAGAKIGGMIANLGGNALKDPKRPDSFKNTAGNILSSAGQGAMMGSAFGPWGTLAGAVAGTVAGGVQSLNQSAAYKKDLRKRGEGRQINNLTTAYNPMMRMGGNVGSDNSELNRVRSLTGNDRNFGRFARGAYKMPTSSAGFSQMKRAGYQSGGQHMPNMYAQDGGMMADAEIEGNEAVLGNPNSVNLYGGASAENASPLGFTAKGAQHGQLNQAGTEGIPMSADEEVYIGSDKLGLDGRNATKKNPSVAATMKPYLQYAEQAAGSKDSYKNNPEALRQIENSLSEIKTKAEEGKFMENLSKMLKKKDRNYEEVMGYIMEENPNEFGPQAQLNEQQFNDMAPVADSMGGAIEQDPNQGMPPQMGAEMDQMQEPMMGAETEQPMMRKGGKLSAIRSMCRKGCYIKPKMQLGGGLEPAVPAAEPNFMTAPSRNANMVNFKTQQATQMKRRPAGVIYDDNGNPIEGDFLPEMEVVDQRVYSQPVETDYESQWNFPEGVPTVTASNPAFLEEPTITDQEMMDYQKQYHTSGNKQIPDAVFGDVMNNYGDNVPEGFLDDATPYGEGVGKETYNTQTFSHNEGPTELLDAENKEYSQTAENPQASIQDVGDDTMSFQNSMNRALTNALGFTPFNHETAMPTPQFMEFLKESGYTQADIDAMNQGNAAGNWSDPNNPIVKDLMGMASNYAFVKNDLSGEQQGTFGVGHSNNIGARGDDAITWQLAEDVKGGISNLRNKGLTSEESDYVSSPNFNLDYIKTPQGRRAFPGLFEKLNNIYKPQGQEIGRNDILSYKKNKFDQRLENDFTNYETKDGVIADARAAARLAKERGFETFIYGDDEYRTSDFEPRPRSSSSRPSTTPSRTPSRPVTGSTSTSRSSYGNASRVKPATIKPINTNVNKNSSYERMSLERVNRANGGNVMPRIGQRITFEHGGTLKSGVVKYVNPRTGDFDIM